MKFIERLKRFWMDLTGSGVRTYDDTIPSDGDELARQGRTRANHIIKPEGQAASSTWFH